jgi:hypothetical protein
MLALAATNNPTPNGAPDLLTKEPRLGQPCISSPRIELAEDAVDAWALVSPFVSEKIL